MLQATPIKNVFCHKNHKKEWVKTLLNTFQWKAACSKVRQNIKIGEKTTKIQVNKMDWKEFLKPTKSKIVLTAIFVLPLIFLIIFCNNSYTKLTNSSCVAAQSIIVLASLPFELLLALLYVLWSNWLNSNTIATQPIFLILYIVYTYVLSSIIFKMHVLIKSKTNPANLKIIYVGIILLYLIISYTLVLQSQQLIDVESPDAAAQAQCAKYTETDCAGKIVTSGSCQYTCTYSQSLNRCKANTPGTPTQNAPAGTTC